MSIIPMARCNADACRQGEIPCPCPERCGVPEELPGDGEWAWLGVTLLLSSALAMIFGVLWVLS